MVALVPRHPLDSDAVAGSELRLPQLERAPPGKLRRGIIGPPQGGERETQDQQGRQVICKHVRNTVHFHIGSFLSWLLEAGQFRLEPLVYYVGLVGQSINHESAFLAKRIDRHDIRELDRNPAFGDARLRTARPGPAPGTNRNQPASRAAAEAARAAAMPNGARSRPCSHVPPAQPVPQPAPPGPAAPPPAGAAASHSPA